MHSMTRRVGGLLAVALAGSAIAASSAPADVRLSEPPADSAAPHEALYPHTTPPAAPAAGADVPQAYPQPQTQELPDSIEDLLGSDGSMTAPPATAAATPMIPETGAEPPTIPAYPGVTANADTCGAVWDDAGTLRYQGAIKFVLAQALGFLAGMYEQQSEADWDEAAQWEDAVYDICWDGDPSFPDPARDPEGGSSPCTDEDVEPVDDAGDPAAGQCEDAEDDGDRGDDTTPGSCNTTGLGNCAEGGPDPSL